MNLLAQKQEEVLQVINRFGVITSTQLSEFLKGSISHVTVYQTKRKLLSLGFLTEEKIGYHLILAMRPSGVDYLGSSLTPFTKFNYSLLKHQLIMNNSLLALKQITEKTGQPFEFITERELRSDYIRQNFTKADRRNTTLLKRISDRIPDFVVVEQGSKIACEVELTRKSSKRYLEKMRRYKEEMLNGQYQQVRYLCENESIRNAVISYAHQAGIDSNMLQLELVGRLLQFAEKQ
ncbi:hypothetical protein [Fictibacillus terranigra]|uniref:Protein involved in plasmid replication-relaxation n=1 Tax=Fictibacillus terranigra TaxID=3058424 RepID=A0ABT8E4S2_9BACL|nr:hypothetical protein [Fictibacillus sp. CENA-BCM004]MDN4072903.1 hypothetical protein [Fictibacillus sp. CENA-BCM004]